MDRIRESKRSSMASSAAGNGFHRRRNRTSAFRDSSEERAGEGVSRRGKSKRRRRSHSRRDEDDENSTDESIGNKKGDDVVPVDAGASATRSANTAVPPFTAYDQITRRSSLPLKFGDEMIGVAVPRKARSAYVKRWNENCVSSSGGGERNFRQQSNSPAEPASPSSSSVSAKNKMKTIGDASNALTSSSSQIEIEIAEVLYGLMTAKNQDNTSSKDHGKKKAEEYSSSALVPCNSTAAELVQIQSEQPASEDCHDSDGAVRENGSSETPTEDIGKEKNNLGTGCGAVTNGGGWLVCPASEFLSRKKLGVEKQGSASNILTLAVTGDNGQRVGKFDIDLNHLMVPPPLVLSQEGDNISRGDTTSKTAMVLDLEMRREDSSVRVEDKEERPAGKQKTAGEIKDAETITFKEKSDVDKHDLERPNDDDYMTTNNRLEEQARSKEQIRSSANIETQFSSGSLSTAVSGHPSSLTPIGYARTLQTVWGMDKTRGSQHPNFGPSQLQRKRCATHHYIAHNILHQRFSKMNPPLPPAIGTSSLFGTKSSNLSCLPTAETVVIGKQSQKHLPAVNQSTAPVKRSAATSDPSRTAIKSSNYGNPMDSTQKKQPVLHQGPQPAPTNNPVHGPAFQFPPGHHQTSVASAASQVGGTKSSTNASSYNKSNNPAASSLATPSTLPAVAGSMSFSYPKFSTNETPYVTTVQNNGHPFPFSTPVGSNSVIRVASPAQATHMPNGFYYSSQIVHSVQHPQQQPHSQVSQPSYINASTPSSSSSHKQLQSVQVHGNSILTSPTMQSQQSQKQHTSLSHPLNHETEMGGDNSSSVANRKSYPQRGVHGQNFTIPVQPANFSFRPTPMSDNVGSSSGNFGDKQQQQQASKGGVENMPYAISFNPSNATNVPSNLNFSSMAQNPGIYQSLPGIAWQGYQAAGTSHSTHQRAYSVTEGKSGGNSSHQGDEKKTTHGKSSTNNGPTTLVFDNSSKSLNFAFTPTNGNWPNCSIASTAVTSVPPTAITSVPLSGNASSSQGPSQLLQLQKQHPVQHQQPAVAARYRASSTNNAPASRFANNAPTFSPTQGINSNQASSSRSSGRTMDSHVHRLPNTPSLRSFSQEQGRGSQGQMQISFGGDYMTSLPPQGQQLLNSNRSVSTTVAGTQLSGGNLKPNPEGRKVSSSMNTSQSQQAQQTESSSAGSGQNSSPVCGRNVPSILSSRSSQLSELKY